MISGFGGIFLSLDVKVAVPLMTVLRTIAVSYAVSVSIRVSNTTRRKHVQGFTSVVSCLCPEIKFRSKDELR